MIAGGEDPNYIARRLVRFAVEDVGLADPQALVQALAAASLRLGSPEGGWRWCNAWFISVARVERGLPGGIGRERRRARDRLADATEAYPQRADAAYEGPGLRARLRVRSRGARAFSGRTTSRKVSSAAGCIVSDRGFEREIAAAG